MNNRYSAKSFEIDEDYFLWLCSIVNANDNDKKYFELLRYMYDLEFSDHMAKLVGNDINRILDGMDLRKDFAQDSLYENYSCLEGPCSLLEMMIALSYRIFKDLGGPSGSDWFWIMIDNLGLLDCTDDVFFELDIQKKIDMATKSLLRRTYRKDGSGGLFPLMCPSTDQRITEIWYQMQAYYLENFS